MKAYGLKIKAKIWVLKSKPKSGFKICALEPSCFEDKQCFIKRQISPRKQIM